VILPLDLRFLVLVRIPITIVARIAIFAVGVVLVEFRGVDKHHSTWVTQAGDDRRDDAGGQIDSADKRPSVSGCVGFA